MNLSTDQIAQGPVDQLVPLNGTQSLEIFRNHEGRKMGPVIGPYIDTIRVQTGLDESGDFRGIHSRFPVGVTQRRNRAPETWHSNGSCLRAQSPDRCAAQPAQPPSVYDYLLASRGRTSGTPGDMLLYAAATITGFALLIWGADRFVVGAAGAARNFGLPTLLIGLTVVAIATSAPEILVSVTAAFHRNTELAVGNAVGSNIANIALVLGATAAIRPMTVRSTILRREMPALLAVTLLTVMLFLDTYLGVIDGLLLICGLVLVLHWLVRLGAHADSEDPISEEMAAEMPVRISTPVAVAWLVVGLVVLLLGARLLVWGAHEIAVNLGVSDLIIGLSVVAVGTSLPELAVSIVSALKGEHDIALGNIIGSNMFNCLAVIGPAAIINPTGFSSEILGLHLPVMISLTLILFVMTYNFTGAGRISRFQGIALLGIFAWYIGYLIHVS